MGKLDGKVALITGAGGGIGSAMARLFAREGAEVVLADVAVDAAEAVARAIGGRARAVGCDVADESSVRAAVEAAGPLDILINNAGMSMGGALLDTAVEDWDRMMAVNLRGPFLLCRAAVRQMLGQPVRGDARGRIVNITSQHGMVGAPGHFAYAVGKGGLVQLTRQVAVEHGRDGVLCNAVAPGKIVTGAEGDLSADETSLAYVRSRTPFSRLGRPDDVASAVAFLASDAATYVSGASLLVDGGWMAY